MNRLTLIILALLSPLAMRDCGAAYGQTTRPAVIGPWGQASSILVPSGELDVAGKPKMVRIDNFARWKARGANTLFTEDTSSETREEWIARSKAAALKSFRKPKMLPGGNLDMCLGDIDPAALKADDQDPDCLGFQYADELDRRGVTLENATRIYKQIKAISKKPVLLNFCGDNSGFGNVWYLGDKRVGAIHRADLGGLFAQTDYVSWDFYLFAGNRPPPPGFDFWKFRFDRVKSWSGNRPQVIVIDCADQNLDGKGYPGPDVAGYEGMIKYATDYCAANGIPLYGVCLFPQKIGGGFAFDNTRADVAASMPAVHEKYFGVTVAQPPQPDQTTAAIAALNFKIDALDKQIGVLNDATGTLSDQLRAANAANAALGTRLLAAEAATKPDAILSTIVDRLRPTTRATTQP